MTKPTAHIDNWTIRPCKGGRQLTGRISGHPRQDEFRLARQQTSLLLKIDEAAGTAETTNTLYTLGERLLA